MADLDYLYDSVKDGSSFAKRALFFLLVRARVAIVK